MKFEFKFGLQVELSEVDEWLREYTPPVSVPKDGLVVDVGAREGDTALFFMLLGYRNLRLVEPRVAYHDNLKANAGVLRRFGTVDLRLEPFRKGHLYGAAFAKFDCEGCEAEADLDALPFPWVAEMHAPSQKRADGSYDYVPATGYRRGP